MTWPAESLAARVGGKYIEWVCRRCFKGQRVIISQGALDNDGGLECRYCKYVTRESQTNSLLGQILKFFLYW